MIRVTKFDGRALVLNAEVIQSVEATPDTLITLTTGQQILVKDKVDAVVEAFKEYKKDLLKTPLKQRSS